MALPATAVPQTSMNLELVPCMFKSQTEGGEAQCVGIIIRTPGSSTGTVVPASTVTTTPVPKPVVPKGKQPLKLQPKPEQAIAPRFSGNVPILPARTNALPSALMPAMVTTCASSGAITVTSSSAGNVIELPLASLNLASSLQVAVPSSLKVSAKTRSKTRPKTTPKEKAPPLQPKPGASYLGCGTSSDSSFEAPPPFEGVSVPSTSQSENGTYLPPISSMAPNASALYHAQPPTGALNGNGCTADDLNAIEIAHSLNHEQELNRAYWNGAAQPPDGQGHTSNGSHAYYDHPQTSYMYNAGTNGHHVSYNSQTHADGGYPNLEYATHQVSNTHSHTNGFPPPQLFSHPQGNVVPTQTSQTTTGTGHHWLGQRPPMGAPYAGALPNQMTSSTPDSGIQSIDGSPPSTSAFTPPMVSPYSAQTSHFDPTLTQPTMSLGQPQPTPQLVPSGHNLHQAMSVPPVSSHIQLPPLNLQVPVSVPASTIGAGAGVRDRSYLDHQRPSCSFATADQLPGDSETDEPLRSISPPALDSQRQQEPESDSDVDYSDMPTLTRADHSKVPEDPPVLDTPRATSRQEEEKRREEKEDEIAISANMDADEIANKLMSSLPPEKVHELLRRICPSAVPASTASAAAAAVAVVAAAAAAGATTQQQTLPSTLTSLSPPLAPPPPPQLHPERDPTPSSSSSSVDSQNAHATEHPSTSPCPDPPPALPVLREPATTTTKRHEKSGVRRNSRRRPSSASSDVKEADRPPSSCERPLTRQSTRIVSPTRPRTPVTAQGTGNGNVRATKPRGPGRPPAQQKSTPSVKSNVRGRKPGGTKGRPGRPSRKPNATGTGARKGRPAKKVVRTVKSVLNVHPFARFHRPAPPRTRDLVVTETKSSSVRRSFTHAVDAVQSTTLSAYQRQWRGHFNVPVPTALERLLTSRSSTLLAKRYDGATERLSQLMQQTHLAIEPVPMERFHPTGSFVSCFARKRGALVDEREPPPTVRKMPKRDRRTSKTAPKPTPSTQKLGPLRISIGRKPQTEVTEVAGKKRRNTVTSSGVTPVPRDDYVKIRSNVLVETPPTFSLESRPCHCSDADPCSSNSECRTRAAFTECTQYSCQLYAHCCNRRLLNNESVHQLQLFRRSPLVQGVRATVDIGRHQLVSEFVGEVLRRDVFLRRVECGQSATTHAVELIPGSYVVDATRKGNLSRFMRHACRPNCVMQRWLVAGQQRVGIFALRDIPAGEELCYDFGMHVHTSERVRCECGHPECRGFVPCMPAPQAVPKQPERLTKTQVNLVRSGRLFLVRNLVRFRSQRSAPRMRVGDAAGAVPAALAHVVNALLDDHPTLPRRLQHHIVHCGQQALQGEAEPASAVVERFDASVKYALAVVSRSLEKRVAEALQQVYLHLKRQSPLSDLLPADDTAATNVLLNFTAERPRTARKLEHSPKVLSATTDLSYMDAPNPVGSYDPDAVVAEMPAKAPDGDSVRCICGIMDEGGTMIQCDRCKYWLHQDCLGLAREPKEFFCPFCEHHYQGTPAVDILLVPQPDFSLNNCFYYRTLVNCRGIQARVNECVYVEKIINDEYKQLLKNFHDEWVSDKTKVKKRRLTAAHLPPAVQEPPKSLRDPHAQRIFHRRDVRVFRIERLIRVSTGERFAFGRYYARPHETFVDPGRKFYRNELFLTPLFDTLPVDAIVGRCLCLEPQDWAAGRPKGAHYLEEDAFICEFKIDKSQKQFNPITDRGRYPINTSHYLFDRFEKPRELKRNFSPFIINSGKSAGEKTTKGKLSNVVKEAGAARLLRCIERISGP